MNETFKTWISVAGFSLMWFYLGYSVGVERWKNHWDKIGERISKRIKSDGIRVVDDHVEPEVMEIFEKAEPHPGKRLN